MSVYVDAIHCSMTGPSALLFGGLYRLHYMTKLCILLDIVLVSFSQKSLTCREKAHIWVVIVIYWFSSLHIRNVSVSKQNLSFSKKETPHTRDKRSAHSYHKEHKRQFNKSNKVAKIRNRYNQVPQLTQDTNGKATNPQKTPQTRAKRSALSQQVTTKHI